MSKSWKRKNDERIARKALQEREREKKKITCGHFEEREEDGERDEMDGE